MQFRTAKRRPLCRVSAQFRVDLHRFDVRAGGGGVRTEVSTKRRAKGRHSVSRKQKRGHWTSRILSESGLQSFMLLCRTPLRERPLLGQAFGAVRAARAVSVSLRRVRVRGCAMGPSCGYLHGWWPAHAQSASRRPNHRGAMPAALPRPVHYGMHSLHVRHAHVRGYKIKAHKHTNTHIKRVRRVRANHASHCTS